MSVYIEQSHPNLATCPWCVASSKSPPPPPMPVNTLRLHFNLKHRDNIGRVQCAEKNCLLGFSKWDEYRRHLNTDHKILKCFSSVMPNCNHPQENDWDDIGDNLCTSQTDSGEPEENVETPVNVEALLQSTILTFIGKLYADPSLPRKHVQTIVDDVTHIFKVVNSACKIICSKDEAAQNSPGCTTDIFNMVIDSLKQFGTEHKRLKAIKSTGYYIEPKEYTLGFRTAEKRVKGRLTKRTMKLTGQFVPIKKILEKFFSMPNVLDETINYIDGSK